MPSRSSESPDHGQTTGSRGEDKKVELRLEMVTGDPLTIMADPDWLREFVMGGEWFSIGEGTDETWINGTYVVTVTRVKEVPLW